MQSKFEMRPLEWVSGRDVSVSRRSGSRTDASRVSSRVSGHCVSLRRFVPARAVHTVAAVRAILTSMTFVA